MQGFGDLYKSTKRINKKTILSKEQKIKQAIQFHLQGNIKEAKNIYKNLINQGCDSPIIFSNYGIILGGLGKLKEAEKYFRKSIQFNPQYALAYSNLGNLLRDLGNLQEAELSLRKAIELKPDFTEAHNNLGDTLIDLGKLKEFLLLSKSTLKIESINQEYKLLTLLRITITNLIKKNFSKTSTYLKELNDLINQEKTIEITNEINKNYLFTFSKFITSLYPLLEKESKYSTSKIIPHFGESHCLSFAHQTISISSQLNQLQPVLITGGKAWHFANNENNQWKDSLNQQIKNHTYSDKVFISFGEIDCRKEEGILNYSIKNYKDISEVCEETIKGYLNYMEKMLIPYYSERYYFGVPAPTIRKQSFDALDIKRIKMIELYNSLLKKEVLLRGSHFLDVYKMTSNNNGINNNIYMCDDIHLSPKCLKILFENYLHKNRVSSK